VKPIHCHDVVIIGAGPSGAVAAYHCAKLGLDTLFIDKSKFPRYKACGGALSEQAMSYLDFPVQNELIERDIHGARARFGKESIEVLKPYRIAGLVTRSKFDYFLMQRAREIGARFLENERAMELQFSPEHVEIVTKRKHLRAKIVIGADGSQGVTSRYVRRPFERNEYAIGLVTEILADNADIDNYIFNSIEVHFGVTERGYGWVFPHEGYFSVGIGGIANRLRNPKALLADFLKKNGFTAEYGFHAHKIPAGGVPREKVADRIILVGDAAGFVDSFYGEGIAYAILSGKIAAYVCREALSHKNGWERDFLKVYDNECYKQFEYNLTYSVHLSKLMHKFPKLFFKLMASDREVLDKWLEVVASRLSYKEFFGWIISRVPYLLLRRVAKNMLNQNRI
jgi:geranylgeranyl reductase family protein